MLFRCRIFRVANFCGSSIISWRTRMHVWVYCGSQLLQEQVIIDHCKSWCKGQGGLPLIHSFIPLIWHRLQSATCMCVPIYGVWLVNGFIDHLYTRLGTTSNYSAMTNLHNSHITTVTTKPFSSLLYLHQLFSGSGFGSAKLNWTLFWLCPLLITSWQRLWRNTPFPTVTIIACIFIAMGTCFWSHFLETLVNRVTA
jgi:hypothetical protein